MQLRILIADDHDLLRRGLRSLVENQPGWAVVGEARNGREAVELAQALQPDVCVLDISMPELNGLEATRQIRLALPKTEVLILSQHYTDQMVHEVLQAGARGYVLKSDADRDLVAALQALQRRKPFFTAEVSEIMLKKIRAGSSDTAAAPEETSRLSPREREIVQLLAEGKSNKEVATTLGISVKTAETHRTNLMRKLGLHSISEVVLYAVRNGIVEP